MSGETTREIVGEQAFSTFTTDQAINPRTAGVGNNVDACDMYISNTGSNDIAFRLAGSSDNGIPIAPGDTLPLYDISSEDGIYELAPDGSSDASIVFRAIANPAF